MNSPAITWRLRKFGRTWWSSLRVRTQPRWLAAPAPVGRATVKPQGLKPARVDSMDGAPRDGDFLAGGALPTATTSARRSWLAASPA